MASNGNGNGSSASNLFQNPDFSYPGSESGSGSSSESDQDDYYPTQIFRDDRFWYEEAYKVLPKFACRLSAPDKIVARGLPHIPNEVCEHIHKYTWEADWNQKLPLTKKASQYILSTLKTRMDILKKHPERTECVHSGDHYMNVINYIRALKGDDFLKELLQETPQMDKYLLDNILPWLGLTDWNSTSGSKRREGEYGGRTHQMNIFKSKLARFLKQIKKKKRLSQKSAPVPASASAPVPASASPAPKTTPKAEPPVPASASVTVPAGATGPHGVQGIQGVPGPAGAVGPMSEPPLSLEELRAKRIKYFVHDKHDKKEGGKRLNTHKLRRKCKSKSSKRKRMCKN